MPNLINFLLAFLVLKDSLDLHLVLDFQAKECGVITEPEIIEHKINHNSKYMVICSDGVWEFMKNEDVRNLGNIYFQKGEVGPFCSSLVKEAVKTWEQCDIIRDDITVVCVYF